MSDYRSFGSNYYQSSQTRKISIGIMADSQPKRNPGDAEKLKSATVIDIQTIKKEKVTDVATKQKNPAQVMTSPWRSPKPTYRKLGTLENVLSKQQTSSFSGSKGLNNGVNRANPPPAFDSFQNFPQHCNGGRNEKVIDKTPERKMEEEPEKVVVASMDKQEKDKTGSTDALRSKLWEILGKPSPANNQEEDVVVNSETPETQEVEKKKNKKKTNFNLSQEKGPVIKPRHNEDTIETDSESPENTIKRPVTRSLLRRGKGTTQKKTKACGGNNLSRKSAEEVNNIFTFEGEKTGTTPAVKPSVTTKKPRGRRKKTVVQCRKETSKSKSKTPSSFESSGTGKRSSSSSSHEVYQQSKTRKQKPDNNTREEEEFHQSLVVETVATTKPGMKFNGLSKNSDKEKRSNIEQENDLQSPTFGYNKAPISSPSSPCSSPEAIGLSKNSDKPGMKFNGLSKTGDKQEKPSNVEPENDLQSPTFGYKAPISSPSPPCSSPEASPFPLHPRNMNPSFDETETPPIFSFGTKKSSDGTKGQASDSEKKLPEFLEKKREYSFGRESSAEPDEDLVLSDEKDSDESEEEEEDSPALKHYKSPEEKSNKKSNLKAKRNSNLKGKKKKPDAFQKFPEIDDDEEDDDDDDGLGRAIGLFAIALQNYEKKLKSAAEKKSSEIIATVSDEIHQELENVKSHIITEAGKTSNVAKTKRKHAETRLQEQQEKMRMIHEKFKDDVGNHLEEFKNTIEGLETNHSELKGTIKKQKTTHQKLIAQFEGGIETKLDNATKRINSVNKSAKGKMLQLKMIVAECLNDDVL